MSRAIRSFWSRRLWLAGLLFVLPLTVPAAETPSTVQPVPRTNDWWQARAELLNRRIQETPDARILFIGDSITQGWEGAGKEVWAKYYDARKAVNLGIGGDRTQHVLWRLQNGNLKGVRPEVAVIMIGTNNSNGEDNTAGEIVEGVRAIVREIQAVTPATEIVLLGIFPRGEQFNNQRGKLAQINQVLQKLGGEERITYLDIGHLFLADDGSLPKSIMPDFLHLSPEGYAIWAAAVEPTVSSLLGEEPVAAAAKSVDVSGDWIWTIMTPQGETEAALELKQEGDRITGRFARDETRWLAIQNGTIKGNQMKWTVERDRPGGGTMTYQMIATVDGDRITGKATTDLDGTPTTMDWRARRN